MTDGVEIRPGSERDDEQRDAFVTAHPEGSFFHLAGWRRAVSQVFRHVPQEILAYRGDELVGALPLMETRGFPTGRHLLSMPYGVYGGALGENSEIANELVEHGKAMAERLEVGHLELRYLNDPGLDLRRTNLYWTFMKDLPEKEEEVLTRMPKKSRAEARKARNRHGLILSEGKWYVDDLYRLFVRNKHGLGSPALPAKLFTELMAQFPGRVHVHLVRKDREPLSAVMSFAFRDTLIAYYSGTAPDADRAYSASNFMYMALQEWAVRRGFRRFDFGRSREDAGAFKFKVNQGFEPQPLNYRFHLVRDRELPSFNPSNPKTQVLQRTWRRLPLPVARGLSNVLARYLP